MQLPPEALKAWSERLQGESMQTLSSKAGNQLTAFLTNNSETLRSLRNLRPPKEDEEPRTPVPLEEGPDPGAEDEDLAEFVLQETLRSHQQLDALEQVAELSSQQAAIWERLRNGKEIAEIAAELDITVNHVSVQKHNAIKRLGAVRKAAGL